MRHINYLKYLLRHKFYVFVACLRVGASPWSGLVHDWSKFLSSEWLPYARCFYAPDGSKQYREDLSFNMAWNSHQKRNKHHWQYWLLTMDRGTTEALPMPRRFVLEMVADWMGAGRAITGAWEVGAWYEKNKGNMLLHVETRLLVESLLESLEGGPA